MAFLKVVKGGPPGRRLDVGDDEIVIGRAPDCGLVLDQIAVSRRHARIHQLDGRYFLEDLQSRNGTFLNESAAEQPQELRDGDTIRICDAVFTFDAGAERDSSDDSSIVAGVSQQEQHYVAAESENDSSIIAALEASADDSTLNGGLKLGVNPETKLRAVLAMNHALSTAQSSEELFNRLLDGLFHLFPQAEAGCVLLMDPAGRGEAALAAQRTRRGDADAEPVRFSRTVVRRAFEQRVALLSADVLDDSRLDAAQSISDLAIRSVMCAPLIGPSQEVQGVVQLETLNPQARFGQDDLELLTSTTSVVAAAVENFRMHERLLHQERMEHELSVARDVQRMLLPAAPPNVPGYDLAAVYRPAAYVGGDYYDYIPLPDDRLGVVVADAAGKGVAPALLITQFSAFLKAHLHQNPDPAEALAACNAMMVDVANHRFVTCVLMVLDPRSHTAEYAVAGHVPTFHRTADGRVQTLTSGGLPLGVMDVAEYVNGVVDLHPGDRLLLYTDGLTEAMDADRREFGAERVVDLLGAEARPDAPAGIASQVVERLLQEVERFTAGETLADDLCIVAVCNTADVESNADESTSDDSTSADQARHREAATSNSATTLRPSGAASHLPECFGVASIDDDDGLRVGEEFTLTAVLRQNANGQRMAGPVAEVRVVVYAAGFDVAPDWMQTVEYVRGGDSDHVDFQLTPLDGGNRSICVEFYYDRHWLAGLAMDVVVEPAAVTTEVEGAPDEQPGAPENHDAESRTAAAGAALAAAETRLTDDEQQDDQPAVLSRRGADEHVSAAGVTLVVELRELLGSDLGDTEATHELAFVRRAITNGDCRNVVMDLGRMRFLNSSFIGPLISMHRALTKRGGQLIFCNVPSHIGDLFKIMRLDKLMPITDTRDDALQIVHDLAEDD